MPPCTFSCYRFVLSALKSRAEPRGGLRGEKPQEVDRFSDFELHCYNNIPAPLGTYLMLLYCKKVKFIENENMLQPNQLWFQKIIKIMLRTVCNGLVAIIGLLL